MQTTDTAALLCTKVKTRTMTDLLSPDSHVAAPPPFRITSCSTTVLYCHDATLSAQALSVATGTAIECRQATSAASALQHLGDTSHAEAAQIVFQLANKHGATLKLQSPAGTSSLACQSCPSCHWSSGALLLSQEPNRSDSPTALTVSPKESSHCFNTMVVDTAVAADELAAMT